ncbi:MAG: hypothetical protein AAF289_03645 [Cyanobacteria bacterium P01_A01_bin.135]
MSKGFSSNWAYIKTELSWLERVLMTAVSRQQQERKRVNQVAQSPADQATAHWWKGLVSLDGKSYYDEHRPPATAKKSGYHKQLQSRIEASYQSGILLVLPYLCDRLQLNRFEKNLLLMGIAPEVNRRYSRLYHYLQGDSETELPSLELVLRLLCRNDGDWQAARWRLGNGSPLLKHCLIELIPSGSGTFLTASVQVMPHLVELLLAEEPHRRDLDALLSPPEDPLQPAVSWADLVLPKFLVTELMQVSDRLGAQRQANEQWGLSGHYGSLPQGQMLLFSGKAGTGKTTAARALATALGDPLQVYDPQYISASRWAASVAEIAAAGPQALLIKSPELWFGPDAAVEGISELVAQRRQRPVLTVLSTEAGAIAPQWRDISAMYSFPEPNESQRLRLWKRAFPPTVTLGRLRWRALAKLPLTGGEIMALARDAVLIAASQGSSLNPDEKEERVMPRHVLTALRQRGYEL